MSEAGKMSGRAGQGVRTGSTWRQRVGAYLIGVAIGCVLLGMIWSARAQRRAAAAAGQGAAAPAQPTGSAAP